MLLAEVEPNQPTSIFEDPPIEDQIMVVTADTSEKKTFERRPWTEGESGSVDGSRSVKQAITVKFSDGLARDIGNLYVPDLRAAVNRTDTIIAINKLTFPALEKIEFNFVGLSGNNDYRDHFVALANIRRGLRPFLVFSDVKAANRHLFPE